jgi:thiol-disulfide isomerase/thioredoxin
MVRRGVAVILILALAGCGDSGNSGRGSKRDVDAALDRLNKSDPKGIKNAADGLEKALAKNPDHVEGWIALAKATQYLARHAGKEEAIDPLFHKSAEVVRKAMKLNPAVLEDDEFRHYAAIYLVNDGCAYGREKKIPEALAALREAVDVGFSDDGILESSEELAEVRSAQEFAPFLEEFRAKLKAAAEKKADKEFAEHRSFDFDFDLKDVNGKSVSKARFAGKILIVDIWGTWCGPCRMEIPHFIALHKEFGEKGLQIVGLNSEGEDTPDPVREVKKFCKEEGVTYPCALITDELTEQIPDFEGFPTTMFFDRKGKARLKVTGYHDIWFLRTVVERLLNE